MIDQPSENHGVNTAYYRLGTCNNKLSCESISGTAMEQSDEEKTKKPRLDSGWRVPPF